jgi:hypothetical protein
MAQNEVFYPEPAQLEVPVALTEVYQITAGRTALQLEIIVCNFTFLAVGYDLKVRPENESSANKHFWRGSKTALSGRLIAGGTEIWHLNVRPGAEWIIEAAAETVNSISITFSPAEKED